MSDWTSAGFDMDKGHHFIAIHAKAPSGVGIVAECVPTQGVPSASFNDDDAVFQITEDTKAIKFTASKDGKSQETSLLLNVELAGEA